MTNFYSRAPFILRGLIIVALLTFTSIQIYAQVPQRRQNAEPPAAATTREVSGIVKDSLDYGIPGSTVRLKSALDSMVVATNADGIFVFKNVKSATYTLSITNQAYTPFVGNFKQNDVAARIVMDPIILKELSNTLNTVVIKGSAAITYKVDTVEYKASDYVVRKGAYIDELLKKMEGMDVGSDGSVTHNGTALNTMKLNGKVINGGDIASTIKNLPAEIVDKAQVIDDYGELAALTGVKDGEPQKILNITTRTDKSVGNTIRLNGGAGNNSRYDGNLNATRINQNQQISVNSDVNKTINGIAGSGGGRGDNGGGNANSSGGSTSRGNVRLSYSDTFSKNLSLENLSYNHNFTDANTITDRLSSQLLGSGRVISDEKGTGENKNGGHRLSFDFRARIDSTSTLSIRPNININSSNNSNTSSIIRNQPNRFLQNVKTDVFSNSESDNSSSTVGGSLTYQKRFNKPNATSNRVLTVELNLNSVKNDNESEQNTNTTTYQPESSTAIDKEERLHRLNLRKNLNSTYTANLTYTEPLGKRSQLQFSGNTEHRTYDNSRTQSNILPSGITQVVDSLSNIFDYSFTQTRLSFTYNYNDRSKFNLSTGVTAIPALLVGDKISLGTSIRRASFNVIPVARFSYSFSRQHQVSLNYSGRATEPSFDQIQPVRDVSNPNNPVVGNPNLKVAFNHSLNFSYKNYISNSKLNYTLNLRASQTQNQVVGNRIETSDYLGRPIFETQYVNLNGTKSLGGDYNISKQLNNRKYNLALSGGVTNRNSVSLNNGLLNELSSWDFSQRFGPRINPVEWLEVNPNINFTYNKNSNSIRSSNDNYTRRLAMSIDGRVIMWNSLLVRYDASKNYVKGLTTNTNNPLIINASLEKEFYNRNLTLTFQAFDVLNQNNLLIRNQSDNGDITESRANPVSRYFMLRLSFRMQKWSGAQGRNGRPPMRRGDGSFIMI